MRYAEKKECSSLLVLLGEESMKACQQRKESEKSVGVSWVREHIVTLESYHGDLLVRVTAPLSLCDLSRVESQLEKAAHLNYDDYQYSARELAGFALAEITAYGVSQNKLHGELLRMMASLDALLYT